MRQVGADGTAAGFGIVRFANAGEQKRTCVVQSPGREEDQARRLKKLVAAGVGVLDTLSLPSLDYDTAHTGAGAQFEVGAACQDRHQRVSAAVWRQPCSRSARNIR